ncbi:MAG TPA: hypothetical protein V6C72_14030 [Chroococcales cyanobacterium]
MSLSQDPALSALKQNFICGYRDITGMPYAGVSGVHDNFGNAVNTTNGAGPHNIQIFMLATDGTVLNCLPGYWNSQDLIPEMQLAAQLNQVWVNPRLSRAQKDAYFRRLQIAHVQEHPPGMTRRSHLQGFDAMYEAEQRPYTSDFIRNPQIAAAAVNSGMRVPPNAFKTTDVVMHERMSKHPFMQYDRFDVASFADYGKQKYDKEEDYRTADGKVDMERARSAPELGDRSRMHMGRRRQQEQNDPKVWGNNQWGNNQWTGDH